LRPIESGTELTLTHADLRNVASQKSHEWGWTGSLAKLVRYLTDVPSAHAQPTSTLSEAQLLATGARGGRVT